MFGWYGVSRHHMNRKFCKPWILCFVCSHVLVILSFVCQGRVVVDVQQQRCECGGGWDLGKVAVGVCMQMAVFVRSCVQQYAAHYQCGALCVITSIYTVGCCTITIHALITASACVCAGVHMNPRCAMRSIIADGHFII